MKITTINLMKVFSFSFLFCLLTVAASAQTEEKASPAKEATGKIGDVTVTINYSSPAVKDRKIWGELEPYGKVWRTGANEATTVTFDKDVLIEGEPLAAGEYSLFTIPMEKGEWTVIFNETAQQWGAYDYDESKDALRVEVAPKKSKTFNERLNFEVEGKNEGAGNIVFAWENITLPIKVKAGK